MMAYSTADTGIVLVDPLNTLVHIYGTYTKLALSFID